MKIAIIGAHRVGKTTLADELLKHLPGYILHMEAYHEMEESGYVFSETPSMDDFIEQFDYAVQQISKAGDCEIFDRCPIDILAYMHAIDPVKNIESFFETAQTIMDGIDVLVFVPIEEPDLIPCQKTNFPKLRSKVNDILLDWISDFGVETIEVNGAVENRRDQILKKFANFPVTPPSNSQKMLKKLT